MNQKSVQEVSRLRSLETNDHDRQDAVVAPENSADLDLLEPDRPPAYTSKMAEETCGVTDKVAPSRRSTK